MRTNQVLCNFPLIYNLGLPLETALNIGDIVLDVNVTPNRSDCLSMIGIAREVAAITGKKMKIALSEDQRIF